VAALLVAHVQQLDGRADVRDATTRAGGHLPRHRIQPLRGPLRLFVGGGRTMLDLPVSRVTGYGGGFDTYVVAGGVTVFKTLMDGRWAAWGRDGRVERSDRSRFVTSESAAGMTIDPVMSADCADK
jgi:hypothetical protein